jgi:multiple sugar transport system ATP-binding protein
MACVEIKGLGMRRSGQGNQEVWALKRLSLTIRDGELLAVVGPSGAGKTTLLRLLAGLEEPTEGSINIGGQDMKGVAPKDRDVALVFQNHALFPHLTARENLALGLVLRKRPAREVEQRVAETARILGLTDCLDRRPAALSGGECQRVALGRAILRQPRLFLLDEPLSVLDTPGRKQLQEEILRLHRRLGATMIFVTHDQTEAMALGDRVAVLRDGTLQQVAAPPTIYGRPANRFVAEFIGSPPMNLFEGVLIVTDGAWVLQTGSREATQPAAIRLRWDDPRAPAWNAITGRRMLFGVRPENVECDLEAPVLANGCPGVVEGLEGLGPDMLLRIAVGDLRLMARCRGRSPLRPGQRVPVRIAAEGLRFFDPQTGVSLLTPVA